MAAGRSDLHESLASLPGALVGDAARLQVLRLADRIDFTTRTFGFECRLRAREAAVDVGFAVEPDELPRIARTRARSYPDGRGAKVWAAIQGFARAWRSDAVLQHWVPFAFLEYDADSPDPQPSIFAGLDSPIGGARRDRDAPELLAAIRVASLLQDPVPADRKEALAAAFLALPATARPLHVGVMMGRAGAGLRSSVYVEGSCAPAYLASLGAAGAARAARLALDRLGPRLRWTQLDFDCGPPVAPTIGFGIRPERDSERSWADLLGDLVREAGASEAKADAILSWRRQSGAPGEPARAISHVKVVANPEGRLESKIYLELRRPAARGPSFE